jgi:hypothetical protein
MESGAARMKRKIPGYFFLTPVWGEEFTRLYTETAIPAQLALGNLPVIGREPHAKYVIYTTPDDAEVIRSAKVFKYLAGIIPVVFQFISEEIITRYQTQRDCFRRGVVMADEAGAAIIFLKPDVVFAEGSFSTLKRLAESGRDVVFVPGIRTVKQDVARILRDQYQHDGVIRVVPRDLMRIALGHLHPLAYSSFWDQGQGGLVPGNLYWWVGTEGITARCFHLHPLFVYPQRKNAIFFGTEDDDYPSAACPDVSRDYVITDSDELLMIELSDPDRLSSSRLRKGSVADTAMWAEHHANARHRRLLDFSLRMHAGIRDYEAWKKAEKNAELVANAIKTRLRRPAWRLLLSLDWGLVHRMLRRELDRRLAAANSFDGTSRWSLSPMALLQSLRRAIKRELR